MGSLTAKQVEKAKPGSKAVKLADGGGLYLLVTPAGGRYWRYDYRYVNKRKTLALGVYPDVTLKQARVRHEEARSQLRNNIDPGKTRKVEKLTRGLAAIDSFEAVAREWFERKMEEKSESYRVRTGRILKNDLYPHIGSLPIAEIQPMEILATLRRIEARGANDIAHRAKQATGLIFRYAVATGRASSDPTRDLAGALAPRREKKHHAAITDPGLLGRLLVAMDGYAGSLTVKTALLLTPLLFQRPGMIRSMEWADIHWDAQRWELSPEQMKMGQPHIVPLSLQAQTLLKELQPYTGNGKYVFPGARGPSRCLSDNTVRLALRDLGYGKDVVTPHGFRATARTLLDEVLGYRPDWIEHQLAHAVKDPNGRAYNRTAHLEGRAEMMQAWADYLDKLKTNAA